MPVDPIVALRFDLPDRVAGCSGGDSSRAIVLHIVPTGDASCHLEWLAARLVQFGRKLRWTARKSVIFPQDQRRLESIRTSNGARRDAELSVSADVRPAGAQNHGTRERRDTVAMPKKGHCRYAEPGPQRAGSCGRPPEPGNVRFSRLLVYSLSRRC
jgi:hypothetical protein